MDESQVDGGLPLVDTAFDSDPRLRNTVMGLINEEIETAGGHDTLSRQYFEKICKESEASGIDGAAAPKATDVIDLDRYRSGQGSKKSKEDEKRMSCVSLEFERMKQTNLLLIAQVGQQAWNSHVENLDSEGGIYRKRVEMMSETLYQLNTARQEAQVTAGKELQDLNERWGYLSYSAAQLRGLLHQDGTSTST